MAKNCVRCGKLIPEERLEALPETQICVGCSEAVGGEFAMIVRLVKTSKTGSLKHNYGGGVEVEFVRKHIRPL